MPACRRLLSVHATHQVYGLVKPRPKAAILPGASLIGRTLEGVSSAVTPGAAQSAATPAETERFAAADTEEEGEGGDDVEQAGERSPSTPPKGRPKQKPPSPEVSPRPEPEGVPPAAAVRVHGVITAAACAALT